MLLLLRHRIARLHAQFALRHRKVPEPLAVLRLLQQLLLVLVVEGQPSAIDIHLSHHIGRFHPNFTGAVQRIHVELRFLHLWHNHQTLLFRQLSFRRGLHADNVVVHDLQAHHLCTVSLCLFHRNRHILSVDGVIICHQPNGYEQQHTRNKLS